MNDSQVITRLARYLEEIQRDVYPEEPTELHQVITGQALQHLKDTFQLPAKSMVLDVGCGQGPALRQFEDWGCLPVGVTLSDEDVAACRSQGFTVVKMDQSFLEFDDGMFDLLWARHVLEHSIFPLFTLREYHRVMKPGALLYVEVPAPETACHHERNKNHYSVFGRKVWHELLTRSGFTVMEDVSYRFVVDPGDDEYYGYYCRKAKLPR